MKSLKSIALVVFSMALLAACQAKDGGARTDLSPQEFSRQLGEKKDAAILVDVRTPDEFNSGHLQGAISLDFNGPAFQEGLAKLPKDKEVYVYCHSGGRSAASVSSFLKAGHKHVTNLADGIAGWKSAGLPVIAE